MEERRPLPPQQPRRRARLRNLRQNRTARPRRFRSPRRLRLLQPPQTSDFGFRRTMPLHLIKLAVGCDSVKELKGWVAERMRAAKAKGLPRQHTHIARMVPKRDGELLAGGSLYWVIRGEIAAREKLI